MYVSTSLLALYFFFNDPATTNISTLSLHDALPICQDVVACSGYEFKPYWQILLRKATRNGNRRQSAKIAYGSQRVDRKSTRLNSSHVSISYAVFCLKKKKRQKKNINRHHSVVQREY